MTLTRFYHESRADPLLTRYRGFDSMDSKEFGLVAAQQRYQY